MLGLWIALSVAAQAGVQWTPVHDDDQATTSIDARSIGSSNGFRTIAVRTLFKDGESGGYIHDLELDCAGHSLRAVHETILDSQGRRVTDGPSNQDWLTPPQEAPFSAVLRDVCADGVAASLQTTGAAMLPE